MEDKEDKRDMDDLLEDMERDERHEGDTRYFEIKTRHLVFLIIGICIIIFVIFSFFSRKQKRPERPSIISKRIQNVELIESRLDKVEKGMADLKNRVKELEKTISDMHKRLSELKYPKAEIKSKREPSKRPSPLSSKIIRYKVKRGDTLYGLSKRFGVSVESIRKANGFKKNQKLYVGQIIIIPKKITGVKR